MDFLHEVEKRLDLPAAHCAQVMAELKSHFDELHDEFVASGMGAAQAQTEAETRMGSPADIAARLNAAHHTASWKSALLCVVPFAASAIYLVASALGLATELKLALLIAIGVVMLAAGARELIGGRRPLWLATWLAAGLLSIPSLLYSLGSSTRLMEGLKPAALSVVLLALLTLIISLATRRLLRPAIIACVISAFSATYLLLELSSMPPISAIMKLAMVISSVVLLVILARLIFEHHTYGSALQAALFLLAVFLLRFADSPLMSHTWSQAVTVVLSALAVIWFTRAPRRGMKGLACYLALFVPALAGQLPFTFQPNRHVPFSVPDAVLSAALWAGVNYLIVISPLMPVVMDDVEQIRLTRAH